MFGVFQTPRGGQQVAAAEQGRAPVYYTHLTLPTIYSVKISVVAVSLKKKKKQKDKQKKSNKKNTHTTTEISKIHTLTSK